MKKIGLALGGGAILGAAHVGILKSVEESNLTISHISGTSIGAFVGAFSAFGKSWKEIKTIASELNWIDVTGISLSRHGLLSNEKLGDVIIKYLGDKNIEDAEVPLALVATDVTTGEKVVIDKGSVAEAVMASTCIPGIFKPILKKDTLLVDGGVAENVPITTLKEMGADYLIGVDLNAKHQYGKPENILEVIINSFHHLMRHAVTSQTMEADLLIKPDLSEFNRANMDQIDELFKRGYEASKEMLTNLSLESK